MSVIAIKNGFLAVFAAVGSYLAAALGGWDAAMHVLVALMVADYITGVLLAAVWHKSTKSASGALDSKAGFKGILKKGMILVLVWLGVLLDHAMGTDYIRMMVVLFFVGNEGISLLENLGLMGVPYPEFLHKALEALHEQGDQGKKEG
jgi:toxin secretion/phage lysis holin